MKLWAWLVEEADGKEGIIAAMIPLVTSVAHVALAFEPLAKAHGSASGRPVRLARFDEVPLVDKDEAS